MNLFDDQTCASRCTTSTSKCFSRFLLVFCISTVLGGDCSTAKSRTHFKQRVGRILENKHFSINTILSPSIFHNTFQENKNCKLLFYSVLHHSITVEMPVGTTQTSCSAELLTMPVNKRIWNYFIFLSGYKELYTTCGCNGDFFTLS
jgi:hypothetical protein